MTIPQSHRPGFFNPVCETTVWSLADRVKNLIGKKMTWSVRQWYGHWRVNKKNDRNINENHNNCSRKQRTLFYYYYFVKKSRYLYFLIRCWLQLLTSNEWLVTIRSMGYGEAWVYPCHWNNFLNHFIHEWKSALGQNLTHCSPHFAC